MMSYIRRLDGKYHFTCSTHPRIDTETSIFYVNSFRPQSLSKIEIFPYNLGRLIYDDTNEEIWSNFYSFRECVHSPLTDSHFRDPIPRRRKIDFEGVFSLFIGQVMIILGIFLCVYIEFCIRDRKYF